MASLQARHTRSCSLYPWAPFERTDGCTCKPMYHVVLRDRGKLVREPVGHNRREAKRALDATEGDVARRTYRVVQDIRFEDWADRWLAGFTGKANSKRVYETTIEFAKSVFGTTKVRDLTPADVRRLLDHIREANDRRLQKENARRAEQGEPLREVSPATLAKHLRQLGACFEAAISEGYATENPCRKLHKTARPRVIKSKPSYYTDAELGRLWPELDYRPLYLNLCKLAILTGLRFGELAALDWSDVDLLSRELHVRKTYTEGIGTTSPKSNEGRTIDLTEQATALLEEWFVTSGGEGLVFEREQGGHLTPGYTTQSVLYPALDRARIPRVGERGRKRDFHSFRHTFARIALENGAEITWVQRQLGHSSITLTVDTYGSWARSAEKSQAKRLGSPFPV
jgi:integrase